MPLTTDSRSTSRPRRVRGMRRRVRRRTSCCCPPTFRTIVRRTQDFTQIRTRTSAANKNVWNSLRMFIVDRILFERHCEEFLPMTTDRNSGSISKQKRWNSSSQSQMAMSLRTIVRLERLFEEDFGELDNEQSRCGTAFSDEQLGRSQRSSAISATLEQHPPTVISRAHRNTSDPVILFIDCDIIYSSIHRLRFAPPGTC